VDAGDLISSEQYILEDLAGSDLQLGIFKPSSYDSDTNRYPVIFFIHDFDGSSRSENALKLFSFLNNNMKGGKIPNCLIVEIPAEPDKITTDVMSAISDFIEMHYRIVAFKKGRVFAGNDKGGTLVCSLIPDFKDSFNACFLFSAELDQEVKAITGIYYYVDLVDKSRYCRGNYDLYLDLRAKGNKHEYRIRQGLPSFQSVLNGLAESSGYLSQSLKDY